MKPIALFVLLAAVLAGCSTSKRPLPTVAKVDLARYSGRWFEVARLPNSFQRAGALATADYTARPDGTVKVINTEFSTDRSPKTVEGSASAVAGSGNARLRVKFGGLAALAPMPAEGNYWILALAPDYSAALVGTPDRKFLWLLTRTQNPSAATRQRMIQRAAGLGFPTEKLLTADWSKRP